MATATIAYTWDEVCDAVNAHDGLTPPDALNAESILVLVDAQIATRCECDRIRIKKFEEHVNGTLIASGSFNDGRHDCVLFYHPDDHLVAKAVADEYQALVEASRDDMINI